MRYSIFWAKGSAGRVESVARGWGRYHLKAIEIRIGCGIVERNPMGCVLQVEVSRGKRNSAREPIRSLLQKISKGRNGRLLFQDLY